MLLKRILFLILLASCGQHIGTLKIKGSDTEVNLAVMMAEEFHSHNDSLLVSVSGGGSGLGIASLLNGTAHIANSSRRINEEELDLFRSEDIVLDSFIFAQDAIAFVVSNLNPLDSLSVSQLATIFSGDVKNWSELTDFEMPINIYGRQSNSGTHDFVKHYLGIEFSPKANQMNGNAQILEAIKVDESGIGFVGAGYVMTSNDEDLKVLLIYEDDQPAFSPLSKEAVNSGDYVFQRPLYQYFRAEDEKRVRPFLRFEQTPTGEAIILSSGYYMAKPSR